MKWTKLGLVYCPDGSRLWAWHSALTPTPILHESGCLRVYAGFRDEEGVSRIGWVDLDHEDPLRVLRVSESPALDVGAPGCFDDNGVILGDVIFHQGIWWMFYVGFQLVARAKFLAFTGLAKSHDGGDTFSRVQATPVMDRSPEGLLFRAIHSILRVSSGWRAYYGVGSSWQLIGGAPYPSYYSACIESKSLTSFGPEGEPCITATADEYRIGRPRIYRQETGYQMFYTVGTLRGTYLPGYAESLDGIHWTRRDEEVGIQPSETGWDSEALSYPALVTCGRQTLMFYNGNRMGRTGFGVAVQS
jgi:hypothetical protein